MNNLNPLQKLLRLKQIQEAIDKMPFELSDSEKETIAQLYAEYKLILASVNNPGDELRGNRDGMAWAKAYCAYNPGADVDLMLAWFANAIETGIDVGRKEGINEGRMMQGAEYLKGFNECLDVLATIRDLNRKGIIRSQKLKQGEEVLTLEEIITRALVASGNE